MRKKQGTKKVGFFKDLPSAFSFMEKAFDIYERDLWRFVGILLVPYIPLFFIAFITRISPYVNSVVIRLILGLLGLLLMIAFFALFLWSQVALIQAIKDKDKFTIKSAYKDTSDKLVPYVLIIFLTGFVTIGGFGLFIVPGIILAVLFFFSKYVLILEGERGFDALLKSKEYVKDRFWQVLAYILFMIFFLSLIFFLIALFFTAINIPDSIVFENTLSQVLVLFLTPFVSIYFFLIYEKLKEVRGRFHFKPKNNTKVAYGILGAWGVIFFGILISLSMIIFATQYMNEVKLFEYLRKQETQLKAPVENVESSEESFPQN